MVKRQYDFELPHTTGFFEDIKIAAGEMSPENQALIAKLPPGLHDKIQAAGKGQHVTITQADCDSVQPDALWGQIAARLGLKWEKA